MDFEIMKFEVYLQFKLLGGAHCKHVGSVLPPRVSLLRVKIYSAVEFTLRLSKSAANVRPTANSLAESLIAQRVDPAATTATG
jgi:hypothetical protein